MPKSKLIYLVLLDDGKKWAFRERKDAVDLLENKLHMTQSKSSQYKWKIKGASNNATLEQVFLK